MTAGERGPTGDHGQSGDTGEAGQRGYVGERGRDGQTGASGAAGLPGATGLTGDAGARGAIGFSRRQVLALFAFVVVSFMLLAWRTEVNTDVALDNRREICAAANLTVENLNAVLDTFLEAVEKSPTLKPAEKRTYARIYTGAKEELAECP